MNAGNEFTKKEFGINASVEMEATGVRGVSDIVLYLTFGNAMQRLSLGVKVETDQATIVVLSSELNGLLGPGYQQVGNLAGIPVIMKKQHESSDGHSE